MVETQFKSKIKILHSDNGGKFVFNSFSSYLSSHGIIHQTTYPHTSEQNGVAERKNCHLLEVVRALMFQMKVPKVFWADAMLTATYLINRLLTCILDFKSPPDVLLGSSSFPTPPKIFRCVCFVHDSKPDRTKLYPKALSS